MMDVDTTHGDIWRKLGTKLCMKKNGRESMNGGGLDAIIFRCVRVCVVCCLRKAGGESVKDCFENRVCL